MDRYPLWLRKFAVDAIEGAIASLLALTIAVPHSWDDFKALVGAIGIGLVSALISAFRRAWPDIKKWLRQVFKTDAAAG